VKPQFSIVCLKEMRDSLRDRRTMLALALASVLVGPLTLFFFAQWMAGMEEKATALKVRIAGAEHAPSLVNFLERNDIEIEPAPVDYVSLVREGRLEAVIVVPQDFEETLLAGDRPRVDLVHDDSRPESRGGTQRTERLLRAFNREVATLRMMARGVSPDLVDPVRVERVNTASERQRGAALYLFITMFATFAPLMGGMAVAIDSTAGERERGSLEPLLANPVRITHVVAGKWLAAWSFAVVAGLLTLGGVVIAASRFDDSRLAAILVFGAPELARFMVLVVPFAAMCAALQMLICTYGRTYREAQTYVSYFTAVVGAVPIVFTLAAPQVATWQLAVPVLGQQVVFNRLARGDAASAIDYLLPSAVALVIALACVGLVSRLLRDERIVFGRS